MVITIILIYFLIGVLITAGMRHVEKVDSDIFDHVLITLLWPICVFSLIYDLFKNK